MHADLPMTESRPIPRACARGTARSRHGPRATKRRRRPAWAEVDADFAMTTEHLRTTAKARGRATPGRHSRGWDLLACATRRVGGRGYPRRADRRTDFRPRVLRGLNTQSGRSAET